MEWLLERPHHVEVQVIGDTHGQDLLYMLEGLGIETSVSLEQVRAATADQARLSR